MPREKNIKKEKVQKKRPFGNWGLRRYSEETASKMKFAQTDADVQSDVAILNIAVGLASYYGKDGKPAWMNRLARELVVDIYHLSRAATEVIDYRMAWSISDDLFDLMSATDDLTVLYATPEVLDRNRITHFVKIEQNLFLAKYEHGMPLDKFILWLKGAEMPNSVMTEWTGIPERRIEWAYKAIAKFLWGALDVVHVHQEQATRRRSASRTASTGCKNDIELLPGVNKPRRKAEEVMDGSGLFPNNDPMKSEVAEADEGAVMPWDDDADTGATTGEPDGDKLVFDQYPFDPDAGSDV